MPKKTTNQPKKIVIRCPKDQIKAVFVSFKELSLYALNSNKHPQIRKWNEYKTVYSHKYDEK